MKRHKILWIVTSLILFTALHLYVQTFTAPSGPRQDKEVLYAEGAHFRSIAEELEKQGIVRNARLFSFLAKWQNIDRGVRAGTYALNTAMRPMDILRLFREGRIIEIPVTIPEGYTIDQIALLLEKSSVIRAGDFKTLVEDPKLVALMKVEGPTLEGYLFPDTYTFPKGIKPLEIVKKMIARYHEVFTPEMAAQALEMGFSERGLITVASIVEKEVQTESERPLVASVIYNRLRMGMPLQCDPTVIYALGSAFTGNLTKKNMRFDSAYNTYRYRGLPPGPIANPGKNSIIAALNPAKSKYLYFVSNNDGTHSFSSTLRDHSAAVGRYWIARKAAGESKETVTSSR